MEHYAGIDVSLESVSLYVVDATGRIIREAKVASEPEILIGWVRGLGLVGSADRVGRPVRCRNGCMPACGKRDSRSNCSRPGTCATCSRRCRSRPTAKMRAASLS
jgi:hypothetical protein